MNIRRAIIKLLLTILIVIIAGYFIYVGKVILNDYNV